ncbi:unnamed protein product [Camellia sinensis]
MPERPNHMVEREFGMVRQEKATASENAFKGILTSLPKAGGGEFGKFYSIPALNDPRIEELPWEERLKSAHEQGTLVHLSNLDPEYTSGEAEIQYGSIGWAVAVTLGYALAARNKRVIASIGDGSFQHKMCQQC